MAKPNNPPKDAAKPKAVRRAKDAPIADTARRAKAANAPSEVANRRTPPPNARVVQPSYKNGNRDPRGRARRRHASQRDRLS